MSTSRLKLYNGALTMCEARTIADLTVNEEGRRLLDNQWNDGAVRHCLEQAQWKFAMCSAKLAYETSFTAEFGYKRMFSKPTDWVLTSAVCQDEYFQTPLTRYSDEIQAWFADLDIIYVKYVSDLDAYGMNLANWPASFTEYVKAYLASKIVGKLSNDKDVQAKILTPRRGLLATTRLEAMNKDAMAGPAQRPATGSWVRSRAGTRGLGYDGGNTNNLIG